MDEQYNDMTAEAIYSMLPEPPQGWDGVAVDFGKWWCSRPPDQDGTSGGKTSAIEAGLTVAIHQSAEVTRLKVSYLVVLNLLSLILSIQKSIGRLCWRVSCVPTTSLTSLGSDLTGVSLRLVCIYRLCTILVLEEIAIAVDTSGSISDDELKQFTSETSAILHELNPERIQFIQCGFEC